MCSVGRGPWPTGDDGNRRSFANYKKARIPLIERIGEYCSYCERKTDLDVEHVVPQKHAEELKAEWSNFLLVCRNCNRRKWHINTSREGYLWPDGDDTFGAFTYQSGSRISVAEGLEPGERSRAEALFQLVGLGELGTDTDRRRHKRRQAWDKAIKIRRAVNGENKRRWVIDVAVATGFFSVWMTVFRNDEGICRRLMQAFPGTR